MSTKPGRWEGPSPLALLWTRWRSTAAPGPRKKFVSPFAAQFWLEWRRQGVLLPEMAGGIVFVLLPVIFFINKYPDQTNSAAAQGTDFKMIVLSLMLFVPLMLAAVIGINIAKFDRLDSSGEVPIYIAIRPLTNGGFVIAKLSMALASSVLTWLVTLAVGCFWLAVLAKGPLFSTANLPDVAKFVIGGVPASLLLILFTWKNLLGGMSVGLTGRRSIALLFCFWKMGAFIGLAALCTAYKFNQDFAAALLRWLTVLLCLRLAVKIAVSIAAFAAGLRRNAITVAAIAWISGGWLVGGLFVAAYAGLICRALHHSELWLWIALAGFQLLRSPTSPSPPWPSPGTATAEASPNAPWVGRRPPGAPLDLRCRRLEPCLTLAAIIPQFCTGRASGLPPFDRTMAMSVLPPNTRRPRRHPTVRQKIKKRRY